MADFQMNPVLQQLFQPAQQSPQGGAVNQVISQGSLIMFRYSFWMHDPVPLLIVTDYNPGFKMRGVNLHYLTFPYISTILTNAAQTPGFSYQNIRGDAYISSAFRSYKWNGISQVKKFDSQFVLKMMSIARTFDPSQVRAIRQSIDQQLQQEYLPKAQETQQNQTGQASQMGQVTGQQTI